MIPCCIQKQTNSSLCGHFKIATATARIDVMDSREQLDHRVKLDLPVWKEKGNILSWHRKMVIVTRHIFPIHLHKKYGWPKRLLTMVVQYLQVKLPFMHVTMKPSQLVTNRYTLDRSEGLFTLTLLA